MTTTSRDLDTQTKSINAKPKILCEDCTDTEDECICAADRSDLADWNHS